MIPSLSLLALCLAFASPAAAQSPGSFADAGETLVSAMMVSPTVITIVGISALIHYLDVPG